MQHNKNQVLGLYFCLSDLFLFLKIGSFLQRKLFYLLTFGKLVKAVLIVLVLGFCTQELASNLALLFY